MTKPVSHGRVLEKAPEGLLSEENRHRLINVLRMKPGDSFIITDGSGHEAEAVLQENATYTSNGWEEPMREPALKAILYAAVTKGDRFETLIEKAVEMGTAKIVPVISERCLVKQPNENKLDRWRKIAISAMIQCGGCILPEIADPVFFDEIPAPEKGAKAFLFHEKPLEQSINSLQKADTESKKVYLATGPEGGFTQEEAEKLIKLSWQPIWLGKRLFRADTAPIIALANLLSPYWI
ncbi:MAG: 16S rRNA (uracil(1498)-N(3))-methyltransferase [Candidatus Riflebacteria bacterium]|nr:16S rRNA (uracil(1498)-N(3))-methyltransferase [Candidatus Riflebacteria bacterium]